MKEQPAVIGGTIRLQNFDPAYHGGLDKEKAKTKTAEDGQRIGELQQWLDADFSHAVLLIFQGMEDLDMKWPKPKAALSKIRIV